MSTCISYECDPLGDYLQNDCGVEQLGGNNQLILLECNHTITDFTNATQINNNINAGTAKLLGPLKAGIDAPSPIEVEPMVSGAPASAVNYDRTVTFMDGNVNATNDAFYDTVVGGRSFGGIVLYSDSDPDNPIINVIEGNIKATGGKVMPNNDNEQTRYEVVLKVRKRTGFLQYAAPAGVFD